jgi:hypothetical protein
MGLMETQAIVIGIVMGEATGTITDFKLGLQNLHDWSQPNR